jgi:hypothetical protein
MIGEFEYLLLCAAARLEPEAYEPPIRVKIKLLTGYIEQQSSSFGKHRGLVRKLRNLYLSTTIVSQL